MADIGNLSLSSLNLTESLSQTFSPVMGILKAAGIVLIVYIVFLIIKSIASINSARNIKRIAKAVDEINSKLDKARTKKK